ncbi:MAG: hypothetical protein Salg2KO_02470 [Salibacteraceae bacterium]
MLSALSHFLTIAFLLVGSVSLYSQSVTGVKNKGYYRSHDSFTSYLHTRGVGIQYQHAWRKTGFSNRILNIELLSLKHPKEHKVNQGVQNSRGYFYGKINSVGLLRASYGWQKVLFDKEIKRGVRVSYLALFGPTIGLVKPVYVDYQASGDVRRTEIVQYSLALDDQGLVEGRAPVLYKLGSTRPYPGGHAKASLNFEYSGDDSFIRAIETGATLDAFLRRIPIMENTYNDQFYLTVYVGFQFGKRHM